MKTVQINDGAYAKLKKISMKYGIKLTMAANTMILNADDDIEGLPEVETGEDESLQVWADDDLLEYLEESSDLQMLNGNMEAINNSVKLSKAQKKLIKTTYEGLKVEFENAA